MAQDLAAIFLRTVAKEDPERYKIVAKRYPLRNTIGRSPRQLRKMAGPSGGVPMAQRRRVVDPLEKEAIRQGRAEHYQIYKIALKLVSSGE